MISFFFYFLDLRDSELVLRIWDFGLNDFRDSKWKMIINLI